MPDPEHDLDLDRYDLSKPSPDGKGDLAKSEYIRLLNQERGSVEMLVDPFDRQVIDLDTPTKRAVLRVLTKKASLTVTEVRKLLAGFEYYRNPSSLRRALDRLVRFGLAVRLTKYRRRVGRASWQLTERGRQVPIKASTSMTIQSRVLIALESKTSWVLVADLAAELQLLMKQTSGALRKLLKKNKTVRYIGLSRRLWASREVYDRASQIGPALGMPSLVIPVRKTKKKATAASARPAAVNSVRRNRTMCLPNKPSLVQAVTDVVQEVVATKATFSSHDITKALRDKVDKNADAVAAGFTTAIIDTRETGTVHVKGRSIAKVEHDDVKEVVNHLYNTGAMVGYSRDHNGTYLEYSPAAVALPPDPTTGSTDPDPAPQVGNSGSYDGSSTI